MSTSTATNEPDGSSAGVRADRWLWATRIYKTRGDAADACRNGQVQVAGSAIKPSRKLVRGDGVQVEKDGLNRALSVLDLVEKRLPAKRVNEFLRDETPPEELERARAAREEARLNAVSERRPSKRDRRQMEAFLNAIK